MATKDISDINLYELLGIQLNAEQSDIRKAYRKKALECHPDKNPDNPEAVEQFHNLSRALEILTDGTARAAYDKVLQAKQAAQLRDKQLDIKRQKLKADLEQRERDALNKIQVSQRYSTVRKTDEEILKEEINRLRKESSSLLKEEQRLLREQLRESINKRNENTQAFDSTQHRIKIKWKADKKDATNGGYSQEKLMRYIKKYGEVVALVMSKKNGSAMVELNSKEACDMLITFEKGDLNNQLEFSWVTPPPNEAVIAATRQSGNITALDFEDLVMRKLRQAEERKRLIEQMENEDNEAKNL